MDSWRPAWSRAQHPQRARSNEAAQATSINVPLSYAPKATSFHDLLSDPNFKVEDTSETWIMSLQVSLSIVTLTPAAIEIGAGLKTAQFVGAGSAAAASGGVSLASSMAKGLVKPGGKLAQVLGGMEQAFGTAAPTNAVEALNVVQQAVRGARLDTGVATVRAGGEIVLENVGGVSTTLGTNGSILVQRGADVLLHLVP